MQKTFWRAFEFDRLFVACQNSGLYPKYKKVLLINQLKHVLGFPETIKLCYYSTLISPTSITLELVSITQITGNPISEVI